MKPRKSENGKPVKPACDPDRAGAETAIWRAAERARR